LIDLHAHILPRLDDGVRSEDEALTAARQAVNLGITKIVATPHVIPSLSPFKPILIPAMTYVLQQVLEEQKVALQILPGAEYFLEPQLLKLLEKGELLTLNGCGRHLLVELPKLQWPDYAENILFELQLNGLTPVLAHPERNAALVRQPEKLRNLVQRGILVQLTAGSFIGLYGKEILKASEQFVQYGLVHFIASDLHGPGKRLSAMRAARDKLKALLGEERAKRIVVENPQAVIRGAAIDERG